MKSLKYNSKWTPAAILAVSALASSCGGQSSRDYNSGITAAAVTPSPSYWTNYGTTTGTTTTTTGTTTTTSTGGTTSNIPNLAYSFSITGAGGTGPTYSTPTITTDSVLKVRVTAGPAGQLSLSTGQSSNFSSTYGCIAYTISALGQTVQTSPLAVGYSVGNVCGAAAANQVIDFSSRLTPGHGPATISVTAAQYSFYCELLAAGWVYGSYSMYCPLHTVYKNHTVTGNLEIAVNGTAGF